MPEDVLSVTVKLGETAEVQRLVGAAQTVLEAAQKKTFGLYEVPAAALKELHDAAVVLEQGLKTASQPAEGARHVD